MKKIRNTFLLSLALLSVVSMGTVAGTYAKYTTNGESSDVARVAKFGVTVTAPTANSGFAKTYATTDSTATTITNSVSAETEVVAPGTNGTLAGATLTGTPEVAVRIARAATVELGENWIVDGTYYCPLEITVGDTTLKGSDYSDIDAFEAAIKTAIDTSKDVEAGTDLSTDAGFSSVTWKWAFEGNDDTKDTKLGDATSAASISIEITTSVTQID